MTTRFGRFSFVAAMLLLLAGCSSEGDDKSRLSGAGSGSDRQSSAPGFQTPPSPPMARPLAEYGIADRVFFALDRSDLSSEARGIVERWATWMRQFPNASLTIEGHCDERGTREYNLGLGERRAEAARGFLVSLGVDPRRVSTVSYGKERPAVVGSAEPAWNQNRRAVAAVN